MPALAEFLADVDGHLLTEFAPLQLDRPALVREQSSPLQRHRQRLLLLQWIVDDERGLPFLAGFDTQ